MQGVQFKFDQEDKIPLENCFAEQFRSLTGLPKVMFGFFDSNIQTFSESWTSRASGCPVDACNKMIILAGQRLSVFTSLSKADPAFVQFVAPDHKPGSYPVRTTVDGYVVAFGEPIEKIFPVMCYPKDHGANTDEHALERLGITFLSQKLSQELHSKSGWPEGFVDATLKILSIECFLVTSDGEIRHDGRSDPQLDIGWKVFGNRLTLQAEEERTALYAALRKATSEQPEDSIVTLTDASGVIRLAVVAPVGRPEDDLVLVLFENRCTDHHALREHFSRAYGLTRSESQIAKTVLEGKSLTEVAEVTNLSISTVRSYMKQIFFKTDTHRQSELIALYYKSILPVGKARNVKDRK